MPEEKTDAIPLPALGAKVEADPEVDVPLAYIPRLPRGLSYRDMIERAVGWSRR